MATETGKAYYEAARKRVGKHSAYHTAVYDFFNAPQVLNVNLSEDDVFLIQVWDNVGVKAVRVLIEGEVAQAEPVADPPCDLWRFPVGGRPMAQVQIFAEDWMGNVGEKIIVNGYQMT